MAAAGSSGMLIVIYQPTQHQIPEHHNLENICFTIMKQEFAMFFCAQAG
jgi:hypothetical protein